MENKEVNNRIKIEIDKNTCITCRKYIKVCPAEIFQFTTEIIVSDEDNCIRCGHCVAICPTDSIIHNVFPAEKVHVIDKSVLPIGEQVAMLIRSRRSNRVFSSQSIPDEYMNQILDAAYRAPTASNSRSVYFTVVTDPQKLQSISAYTIREFSRMIKYVPLLKPLLKLLSPALVSQADKIKNRIDVYNNGKDTILRGAKAVIFFHTPKEFRFGTQDANLAYQNASLMAESLGVAHFYTGYVCAVKNKKELYQTLGIKGEIQAGMALGMPVFTFEKYIDRESIKVDWI